MRDLNRDLGVVPMYIVNRSSRSDDGGKPTFWVVCSTYLGICTYVVLDIEVPHIYINPSYIA